MTINKSTDFKIPPYDSELAEHLDKVFKQVDSPLTEQLIPSVKKKSVDSMLLDVVLSCGGKFSIEEFQVKSYDSSHLIEILVCTPVDTKNFTPVLYHIHGGGMVAGSYRSVELLCDLQRVQDLKMSVVSINYRLAPDHQYPIPIEDCYYGLDWIQDNANTLKFDKQKIVLSGNSAGGGLAAALALLARDRQGPTILGQMLQCPMLDDRCNTFSAEQLMNVGVWNTMSNKTGWNALLGKKRASDEVKCYAAASRAQDLSNLPETFIDVGSVEALRDEAIEFANRIWQAGGKAELHVWGGAFHSFDQWVPDAQISEAANIARIQWLKRLLRL